MGDPVAFARDEAVSLDGGDAVRQRQERRTLAVAQRAASRQSGSQWMKLSFGTDHACLRIRAKEASLQPPTPGGTVGDARLTHDSFHGSNLRWKAYRRVAPTLRPTCGFGGSGIHGDVVQPKCGSVIVRLPSRSTRTTISPFSSICPSMRRARLGEAVQ